MKHNPFLSATYFAYCILSLLVLGIFTVLSLTETIHQIKGDYTSFNQTSTMTDKQILLYCVVLTLLLGFITTFTIVFLIKDRRKIAFVLSSIGLATIGLIFYIEALYQIQI